MYLLYYIVKRIFHFIKSTCDGKRKANSTIYDDAPSDVRLRNEDGSHHYFRNWSNGEVDNTGQMWVGLEQEVSLTFVKDLYEFILTDKLFSLSLFSGSYILCNVRWHVWHYLKPVLYSKCSFKIRITLGCINNLV